MVWDVGIGFIAGFRRRQEGRLEETHAPTSRRLFGLTPLAARSYNGILGVQMIEIAGHDHMGLVCVYVDSCVAFEGVEKMDRAQQ